MPSLSDELGIAKSLSQELGIGGPVNVLPEGMRKAMAWSLKKPVPKALDVIGDVIAKPKKALEKNLRGKGVKGKPQNEKEQLAKLRYENPYLYPLARAAAQSPGLSKALQREGKSAKNIVNEMNQGWLPSAAGGFLQSMANAPISIANAGLEQTNLGEIPYLDLEQYKPSDTTSANLGFKGGQLGGYLAPYSATSKILGAARPKTGIGGLISDLAVGGGTGYLLGGEEGDIGRYLGGTLGAIAEPLQSLGASKIASRVVEQGKKVKGQFNKRYSAIFKGAEKSGIKSVKVPNAPYAELNGFSKSRYGKFMQKFLDNPSVSNAHKLQSDLGKYIKTLDNATNTRALSGAEIDELPKLIDAQKRIRGSLFEGLSKDKKLATEYAQVTKDYAKNGTTYKNKGIKDYMAGERTAADLVKYLNNSVKSRAKVVPKHPEISINQTIKKVAPWLTGAGALLGTGNWLANQIGGLLHSDE